MIWLRKLFVCWWGGCGMVTQSDDTHVWGECMRCGKTAGICTREALRRYCEAKDRHEAAKRKMREEGAEIIRQSKERRDRLLNQ